jgi:hypothetical protein
VVFLSTPISTGLCRLRSCNERAGRHDVGGIPERDGGQGLSLRSSPASPARRRPGGPWRGSCVVGAIWLIAPTAFSIATTDFAASATRK